MPPLRPSRPKDPRPPQHRGTRVPKSPNVGDAPKNMSSKDAVENKDSMKKDSFATNRAANSKRKELALALSSKKNPPYDETASNRKSHAIDVNMYAAMKKAGWKPGRDYSQKHSYTDPKTKVTYTSE